MVNDLDGTEIVIKYNQVYTPNPEVCTGKTFPSYTAMRAAIGGELDATAAYADAHHIPFIPYKAHCVLKPEYENEKLEVGISNDSKCNA
jgi:hypothetical protein